MKRLILMRHAKSDWSSGATVDFDRPLNARGRDAATRLGSWLHEAGHAPDQVLSSSAVRTRETCALLRLAGGVAQGFTRDLYLATHDVILKELRRAKGEVVLMVGHNPGIATAAAGVLTAPPDHPRFEDYPTGATLVADFDITDWAHADWGCSIARHFVVPRDV